MDNRKEKRGKTTSKGSQADNAIYCIRQQPPLVALQFLLPAKRREERQTDFISAISIRGDARHKYAHNTTNIIDKVKGRSS